MVKNPPTIQDPRFDPRVGKIPWSRKWLPIPGFFPGESLDRGDWWAKSIGLQRVRHDWVTKQAHMHKVCICKSMKVKVFTLSCLTLCNPMDCTHQASLPMEFSRQEYWSGLPFPFPGDLPNPGIEPRSPAMQADSLPSELPAKPMQVNGFSQDSFIFTLL